MASPVLMPRMRVETQAEARSTAAPTQAPATQAMQTPWPTPGTARPTLLSRALLGSEGSRQAWRFVTEAFLDNPLPPDLRTALTCAAWEGPGMSTLGIHSTGISLLDQGPEPLDLSATWKRLLDEEETRALLAVTIHVANGHDVPPTTMDRTLSFLGDWRQGWQRLVVYTAWVDRLYRTHASEVIPLEDPRLEPWLARLVKARGVLDPILPVVRDASPAADGLP